MSPLVSGVNGKGGSPPSKRETESCCEGKKSITWWAFSFCEGKISGMSTSRKTISPRMLQVSLLTEKDGALKAEVYVSRDIGERMLPMFTAILLKRLVPPPPVQLDDEQTNVLPSMHAFFGSIREDQLRTLMRDGSVTFDDEQKMALFEMMTAYEASHVPVGTEPDTVKRTSRKAQGKAQGRKK